MSSIVLALISLIFSQSLGSDDDLKHFRKQTICEDNNLNIDSVVDLFDYRLISINQMVYEYDYRNEFRRRMYSTHHIEDYDLSDESRDPSELNVQAGKYLSGFYIKQFNCSKKTDFNEENCTQLMYNYNAAIVVVIFNQFANRYLVISKKYSYKAMQYFGIKGCPNYGVPNKETDERNFDSEDQSIDTNGENGTESGDQNEGQNDGQYEDYQNDITPTVEDLYADCGPYKMTGRVSPRKWLLKGLAYNRRHKFLPLFYNEKSFEIIVVLNREYETLGSNPSLIREHSRVYWKSLKYEDPSFGWAEKPLSDSFTYTAFITEGKDVYLIAERFHESGQRGRGPSVMLRFDLNKKEVIENTNKNPLQMFDCSFSSDGQFPYIVIGVLALILLLVIIGWIGACIWYCGINRNTNASQSTQRVELS